MSGPGTIVLYGRIFSHIFIFNAINTLFSLPWNLGPSQLGKQAGKQDFAFEQSQEDTWNPSSKSGGLSTAAAAFFGGPLCEIQNRAEP